MFQIALENNQSLITHTFRGGHIGWVSSMARYADVKGAPEALVLRDGWRVLLNTFFMVKLPT